MRDLSGWIEHGHSRRRLINRTRMDVKRVAIMVVNHTNAIGNMGSVDIQGYEMMSAWDSETCRDKAMPSQRTVTQPAEIHGRANRVESNAGYG
jgi:hypothetical protein